MWYIYVYIIDTYFTYFFECFFRNELDYKNIVQNSLSEDRLLIHMIFRHDILR